MKLSVPSSVIASALLAACSSSSVPPTATATVPEPSRAAEAAQAPVVTAEVEAPAAAPTPVEVTAPAVSADDVAALIQSAKAKLDAGDANGAAEDMKRAGALAPKDFAMDLALWRKAVDASRKAGGSKEPDLLLIEAEVAVIRGRAFKAHVASGTQSPEEFGEMVEESIDEEVPEDERDDMQAGLHRLGLIPEDFDMKEEVTGALMSQAAAYYDPEQDMFFNLFTDMPPELVETTAAHELVHALQDQYFDLDAWIAKHEDPSEEVRNDDRTLALRCVVEGEATFVQTVWQLERMMRQTVPQAIATARMAMPMVSAMETEQLVAMVKAQTNLVPEGSQMAEAIDAMDDIEPYVLVPLFAAYMSGANLVTTVHADPSGWAAVDKLYESPPQTSEQCLHPQKYAKKRDLPTPVALPEFPEIDAAGWGEADAAVHGELYLRVLLKRNGVGSAEAKKAASGWDGDIYRAWISDEGQTAIVLATTWDTEADAKEFFDAYRAVLAKKYEKLAAEAGDDPKALRYRCGDEALGTGALLLRGLEVFAVEGFPESLRGGVVEKLLATKFDHVE